MNAAKKITGQVIYMGPTLSGLLPYGRIYRDGIHSELYNVIARCPSIGELFIPIAQVAAVRRELNLDLARNVRGQKGRYVTFYKEVQKWIRETKQTAQKPITIKETQNA